jgi:hypothetical protein
MSSLRDVFWIQVDRRVGVHPVGRRRLKSRLMAIRHRDKNTYTNWLGKPVHQRPDIRLSDLEDMATALDVAPVELITSDPAVAPQQSFQLELPFPRDGHHICLELEATDSALMVRIGHPAIRTA